MPQLTIGDRRTFLLPGTWWLPDRVLVMAGPFLKGQQRRLAWQSQKRTAAICLTKRVSKRSLFQAKRGAGFRPPAEKKILSTRDGPQERSAGSNNSGENVRSDRRPRSAEVGQGPPRDRRTIAAGGERKGSEGRSEIDRPCGWGQPKSRHALRGRASPASPATGGLSTAGTSSPTRAPPRLSRP
jgi:hypothetical protein